MAHALLIRFVVHKNHGSSNRQLRLSGSLKGSKLDWRSVELQFGIKNNKVQPMDVHKPKKPALWRQPDLCCSRGFALLLLLAHWYLAEPEPWRSKLSNSQLLFAEVKQGDLTGHSRCLWRLAL